MTIRSCRLRDAPAMYDVCLRTGAHGDDASALYSDPKLLGEVYVGPYLHFAPEFAFVAEDDQGVGGYALGVPDTAAFEAACESAWWPPLRRRYKPDVQGGTTADAELVRHIHVPPAAPAELIVKYPAHLHIDLLPRLQGKGYGRRLMTALFDRLAAAGVAGVHLGVSAHNTRAIGFYRHLGMAEYSRTDRAITMTLSLK